MEPDFIQSQIFLANSHVPSPDIPRIEESQIHSDENKIWVKCELTNGRKVRVTAHREGATREELIQTLNREIQKIIALAEGYDVGGEEYTKLTLRNQQYSLVRREEGQIEQLTKDSINQKLEELRSQAPEMETENTSLLETRIKALECFVRVNEVGIHTLLPPTQLTVEREGPATPTPSKPDQRPRAVVRVPPPFPLKWPARKALNTNPEQVKQRIELESVQSKMNQIPNEIKYLPQLIAIAQNPHYKLEFRNNEFHLQEAKGGQTGRSETTKLAFMKLLELIEAFQQNEIDNAAVAMIEDEAKTSDDLLGALWIAERFKNAVSHSRKLYRKYNALEHQTPVATAASKSALSLNQINYPIQFDSQKIQEAEIPESSKFLREGSFKAVYELSRKGAAQKIQIPTTFDKFSEEDLKMILLRFSGDLTKRLVSQKERKDPGQKKLFELLQQITQPEKQPEFNEESVPKLLLKIKKSPLNEQRQISHYLYKYVNKGFEVLLLPKRGKETEFLNDEVRPLELIHQSIEKAKKAKLDASVIRDLEMYTDIPKAYRTRDNQFFLTSDVARLGSLDTLFTAKPPLSEQELLDLFIGIAKGFAALHKINKKLDPNEKIYNWDFAARNVLVDMRIDQNGKRVLIPKITDWGFYKKNDKGKIPLRWVSPERMNRNTKVANDNPLESDIWAFGVTMIETILGVTKNSVNVTNELVSPFSDITLNDWIQGIYNGRPNKNGEHPWMVATAKSLEKKYPSPLFDRLLPIMCKCFLLDPTKRIKPDQMVKELSQIRKKPKWLALLFKIKQALKTITLFSSKKPRAPFSAKKIEDTHQYGRGLKPVNPAIDAAPPPEEPQPDYGGESNPDYPVDRSNQEENYTDTLNTD